MVNFFAPFLILMPLVNSKNMQSECNMADTDLVDLFYEHLLKRKKMKMMTLTLKIQQIHLEVALKKVQENHLK